jgi:hypothetical protein
MGYNRKRISDEAPKALVSMSTTTESNRTCVSYEIPSEGLNAIDTATSDMARALFVQIEQARKQGKKVVQAHVTVEVVTE